MPRRATSTSYGAEHGNTPNPHRTAGPGDLTETFRRRCRVLATRAAEAQRLENMLAETNADDELWLRAFDRVADRGFGKAVQAVDVTSTGALLPAAEREARVRAIVEAVLARGEGRVAPATVAPSDAESDALGAQPDAPLALGRGAEIVADLP